MITKKKGGSSIVDVVISYVLLINLVWPMLPTPETRKRRKRKRKDWLLKEDGRALFNGKQQQQQQQSLKFRRQHQEKFKYMGHTKSTSVLRGNCNLSCP